jgi:hypothetical protein
MGWISSKFLPFGIHRSVTNPIFHDPDNPERASRIEQLVTQMKDYNQTKETIDERLANEGVQTVVQDIITLQGGDGHLDSLQVAEKFLSDDQKAT